MADYHDYIIAANLIDQANAMLGNGRKCSWTAEDLRDLASSVAAEKGVTGTCPQCRQPVEANTSARIRRHRDSIGKDCTASGQWFHMAVEVTV